MCYTYEQLENRARKSFRHNHPGEELPDELKQDLFNLNDPKKDTALYPGKRGLITLLGNSKTVEGYFGLLSSWDKKFGDAKMTFNARSENILKLPTWRGPFSRKQRCLIHTTGFYETDKKTKKKYFFSRSDQEHFFYAGLYNFWVNPENNDKVLTYAIITTEPNELVSPFHFRMPVILDNAGEKLWMNEAASTDDLLELMHPFSTELMTADEVEVPPRKKNTGQTELGF